MKHMARQLQVASTMFIQSFKYLYVISQRNILQYKHRFTHSMEQDWRLKYNLLFIWYVFANLIAHKIFEVSFLQKCKGEGLQSA